MALTALDHVEIHQLYSRFNISVDLGDIDTYVDTFIEDGWYDVQGVPNEAPALGRNVGRDGIRAMVENLSAGLAGHCRHFVSATSMLIDGDGDGERATTKGYLYLLRGGTVPQVGVYLTGIFNDKLVKVDGRWYFESRSVQMDPQPNAGTPTDVLVVKFDELNPAV